MGTLIDAKTFHLIGDDLPGRHDSVRHAWRLRARACQIPWMYHLEILGAAEWEFAGRPSLGHPIWPDQCWLDPAGSRDWAASGAAAVQPGAGGVDQGCVGQQGAGREGLAGYQVRSPFREVASLPTTSYHEMPQARMEPEMTGNKGARKVNGSRLWNSRKMALE